MKISKTKEELVNMYIDSLKEGKIPWRERWVSSLNVNGISDKEYKGINQLLLSYVTYKEQYNDKSIPANNFIKKIISKLGVKYSERGNEAFYSPTTDEIVLPESKKFYDEYSYKDYLDFKEHYLYELNQLENERSELNINFDEGLNFFKKIKMHNKITVLNRNIINEFIENIYVDENKNVTIEFKYQDEYNQLLNYINDKKM